MKPYWDKVISDEAAIFAMREHRFSFDLIYDVPRYLLPALARYVVWAIPPGSFLQALLSNDLMEAASRADSVNAQCLYQWAVVLHNHVPANCKGSREIVEAWQGLNGRCRRCEQPLDVLDDTSTVSFEADDGKLCVQCVEQIADEKHASQVAE